MTRLLNNTRVAKMRRSIPAQITGRAHNAIPYVVPYVAPLLVSTSSMLSQVLDPLYMNISAFLQ